MNKNLILDFNSPKLTFNVNKISEYDFDTIYNNISNFKSFIDSSVLTASFNKIFNTVMFQSCLGERDTATVENLLEVYNTIGEMGLLNEKLPKLDTREFMRQLRLKGYYFKTGLSKNPDGSRTKHTYIHAKNGVEFYE